MPVWNVCVTSNILLIDKMLQYQWDVNFSAQSLALQQCNSAILRGCQPDRISISEQTIELAETEGRTCKSQKAVLGAQNSKANQACLASGCCCALFGGWNGSLQTEGWLFRLSETSPQQIPTGWKMLNLSTEGFANKPLSKRQIHVVKKWSIASILQGDKTCYHGEAGVDGFPLGFPTNPIAHSAAFLGGSQKFKSSECGIRCLFFVAKNAWICNSMFQDPKLSFKSVQILLLIIWRTITAFNRPFGTRSGPVATWTYQPKLQMSQKRHGSTHATFHADPCSTSAPEMRSLMFRIVWRCLNHLNCWIIGPPCPPPVIILPFWGQSNF